MRHNLRSCSQPQKRNANTCHFKQASQITHICVTLANVFTTSHSFFERKPACNGAAGKLQTKHQWQQYLRMCSGTWPVQLMSITPEILQRQLNALPAQADQRHLTINFSKTKVGVSKALKSDCKIHARSIYIYICYANINSGLQWHNCGAS